MNYKIILLIISLFILSACNQEAHKNKKINIIYGEKYKNTGFALAVCTLKDKFKNEL